MASEIAQREPHITVLFNNAGIPGPNTRDVSPSSQSSGETPAEEFTERLFAISPEQFDDVLRTNAVGAYWMSVAFLPLLEKWKASEGGKRFAPQIVMTSSINGWSKAGCISAPRLRFLIISYQDIATSSGSYAYNMSKSAIGHFTSSLAHELLPLGIRVNGIAPGVCAKGMNFELSLTDGSCPSAHAEIHRLLPY